MQDLLIEALKDAKNQAQMIAEAIDQKVTGLISVDKNAPKSNVMYGGEILCMSAIDSLDECEEIYDNSNALMATNITLTENIYTVWEIE